MDISGVFAIQCSHVVVHSLVDLIGGEEYVTVQSSVLPLANLPQRHIRVDYGLHRGSRLHQFPPPLTQRLPDLWKGSYDNYCIWTVNKTRRFAINYPDDVHLVEGMSGIVPIVHIRNHKDDCWYLFGGSYQHGAGRFTGETAELMWPYLNSYAGQTRQMSPGHRHDFINLRLNDWNWFKAQRNGMFFFFFFSSVCFL
jgi:hypothetical protein